MKKLMKKYGHVWILSYGLIYLPWFAALQQNVGKPYHVMHTALDDLIPFNEYFIVPYLLWFLYVAAAIAYFFFTSKDDYYRLCTFLFTGMTISLLVCTLYPNGTDFRPVFSYVEKLREAGELRNLKGLMYFTDGFGEYPVKPTDYETVFVFYGDEEREEAKVPSWAIKLYLDSDNR